MIIRYAIKALGLATCSTVIWICAQLVSSRFDLGESVWNAILPYAIYAFLTVGSLRIFFSTEDLRHAVRRAMWNEVARQPIASAAMFVIASVALAVSGAQLYLSTQKSDIRLDAEWATPWKTRGIVYYRDRTRYSVYGDPLPISFDLHNFGPRSAVEVVITLDFPQDVQIGEEVHLFPNVGAARLETLPDGMTRASVTLPYIHPDTSSYLGFVASVAPGEHLVQYRAAAKDMRPLSGEIPIRILAYDPTLLASLSSKSPD